MFHSIMFTSLLQNGVVSSPHGGDCGNAGGMQVAHVGVCLGCAWILVTRGGDTLLVPPLERRLTAEGVCYAAA